ncbi:hypothetical protein AURDEDRAFT_177674 [Auricularia subglabra TFB-10046 SS5]|uniref:Uncharacterized protein n=1 Tax=Auricularia subglabra (strain TFB-10046 / SS5) TaxID=717982 RepID=J0D3J0_AURST|nr:hypothetical protein AURDEDRAFT_177674 [Auricularia subglabra TFB-10046 SS5]
MSRAERGSSPHTSGRPPDSFERATAQPLSPSNGDTTVMPADLRGSSIPPGSGLTARFAELPQSSLNLQSPGRRGYIEELVEDGDATFQAQRKDSGSLGSSNERRASSWEEAPEVHAARQDLMDMFRARAEVVDLRTCAMLPAMDTYPDSARGTTLEDRLFLVRRLQITEEFVSYSDVEKQSCPRLTDGVTSLVENVSNRLKALVATAKEKLPWADDVPTLPEHWNLDCVLPLCAPSYSLVELLRWFNYTRGWIDYAGSVAEVLLELRSPANLAPEPQKPIILDSRPADSVTSVKRLSEQDFRSWAEQNRSPMRTPGFYSFAPQAPIQAKRVTIAEPAPKSASELDMLASVAKYRTPANRPLPTRPGEGRGAAFASIAEEVRKENETLPLRPDSLFDKLLAKGSEAEVSRLLALNGNTPRAPAQHSSAPSQYHTPAGIPA